MCPGSQALSLISDASWVCSSRLALSSMTFSAHTFHSEQYWWLKNRSEKV